MWPESSINIGKALTFTKWLWKDNAILENSMKILEVVRSGFWRDTVLPFDVRIDMTTLERESQHLLLFNLKSRHSSDSNWPLFRSVFYPIRVCNGSTTLDLWTGVEGVVGHTAWAPEGHEGRYQAGPKGRNLEVGARRAPTLLVWNIAVKRTMSSIIWWWRIQRQRQKSSKKNVCIQV